MHTVLKSLVAVVALFALNAAASAPQGEVVIRTRSGKVLMGKILTETSKGYLLAGADGTSVVEFRNIVEIRELASTASAPAEPPPPLVPAPVPQKPEVIESPVAAKKPVPAYYALAAQPEAPKPAPVEVAAPPPPERPVEPAVTEVAQKAELTPKRSREGFHFGLGLGAMALPPGFMAQLQGHFEFNFGRPVYRISLNAGVVSAAYGGFLHLMFSLDNIFQFNITSWLAAGAGVQVGVAVGFPFGFVTLSPLVQPVVIKLGDRGQHQISVTGAVTVLSNTGYDEGPYNAVTKQYDYREINYMGVIQTYLGYSYLF
jgi:hypothetical protein